MTANTILRTAKKLAKNGGVEDAIAICDQYLTRFPANKRVRQELSQLVRRKSARLDPPQGEQAKLLKLLASGDYSGLGHEISTLIELFPDSFFLWAMLGRTLLKRGHPEEAHQAFERAASINPFEADAFAGQADVCRAVGQLDQAISLYEKALKLQPDNVSILNNAGNALLSAGRGDDAVQLLSRASKIEPKNGIFRFNLGNAFKELGRLDMAETCFREAGRLAPDLTAASYNLGLLLRVQGNLPEAVESFRTAVAGDPLHDAARAEQLHQMAHMCDWQWVDEFAQLPEDFGARGPGVGPFSFLVMEDNPAAQRRRSERYAERMFQNSTRTVFSPPGPRPKRLKIGYFSADFHDHATMHLIGGLFAHHDRDRFDIRTYSFGPETADDAQNKVRRQSDGFRAVGALSNQEIAEMARKDGLDIAVDLKGFTGDNRAGLFAHGAAPVQIAWLGYPGTMGSDVFDYVIADEVVLPPDQRDGFTEQVICLPGSYQINDDTREISPRVFSRADCGLPDRGVVFCCFNNSYKIGPAEFDVWMRILHQVDDSVLWLLKGNAWVETALRREAQARGIDPDRLVFADRMPIAEHLARHRLADLFLDTFNVNAHTTASDALWAGLPVVTRAGSQFAARVAASLLSAVGMPELVTTTTEAYERLILDLALDPERLLALRAKLDQNRLSSPLFDTAGFVRHLETAYDLADDRRRSGQAPADFKVTG